jgi:rubrerythrin
MTDEQPTELQQAREETRELRVNALNKWPEPLNYLAAMVIRHNAQEWLVEKPETVGAERVREYGLTENQERFLTEVAERMAGGYWICPVCQTVNIGAEKPLTCNECGSGELVEAHVLNEHGEIHV